MNEYFPLKTFKNTVALLSKTMELQECESVAYLVMENAFQLSRIDVITNRTFTPDDTQQLKYEVIINRLKNQEPIQYILKETEFYGRTFHVNPSVLIPRQETELLIHIIKELKNWDNPFIVDIGTGSGCIACSLDLEIDSSKVIGYDVSDKALEVAKQNASLLNSQATFAHLDIIHEDIPAKKIDLIVSNPPYVTHQEKRYMHANVLNYEPHVALFVSDDDPLIFYKVIIQKAKLTLVPGGIVFFEINEQFGKNILLLFQHYGFENPIIHKDLNDKQRFVSASLP